MTTDSRVALLAISIDAGDAAALAAFWAHALGRRVDDGADAISASIAATDAGPRLLFHGVPEAKAQKNRLHLDLVSPDAEGAAATLIALGARQIRSLRDNGGGWISMADPEGNEFDLVAAS